MKVGCTTWKRNLLLLSNWPRKRKMLLDTPTKLHTSWRVLQMLQYYDIVQVYTKKKKNYTYATFCTYYPLIFLRQKKDLMLIDFVKRRSCWNFPLFVTHMKGKKRSLLVQLNNHIHITGLFLATRTKFSKTLTLPTYTGVRVEGVETKHVHGSCYPNYYPFRPGCKIWKHIFC